MTVSFDPVLPMLRGHSSAVSRRGIETVWWRRVVSVTDPFANVLNFPEWRPPAE